jgi:hypothetical protein
MRTAVRAAAPAIVLAVAVLIPFLGKAFTIDDPLFLFQAEHLLHDPLHPTAFDVVWSTSPERMSAIMASGPGMAYLLVPCVALDGAAWAAHLVQLAALVLALLATVSLARRLGLGDATGRDAAILLAATPAVLAMSGTAMPDVPAMAFGVCGVERAVAWSRDRRWHQAVAAALSLSAATLCRSHLIALLGVAALASLDDPFVKGSWADRPWVRWAPLATTLPIVALVLLVTRDPQASATAVAGAAQTFFFAPAVPRNLTAYFAHWVLVLPLGLPWLVLHPRRIFGRPVFYLAAALAWLYLRATPDVGPVVAAPIAALGAAVLWDLLLDAVRRKDGVLFLMGLWLLTPAIVLPYLHLPSKYLLAAAPAAALAVAHVLAQVPPRRSHAVLGATVIAGLALGVLILRADAAFAGVGRRAAETLIAPQIASGKTVWFNGHWGFQWYAERAGARPLTAAAPHPQWGDLVVSSRHAEEEMMGAIFMRAMPKRRLVAAEDDASGGGRLMSRRHGAGFFSNSWGYLPWAWGRDPVDRYELWSIE